MSASLTGTLILVRHHESEYNKLGLWTGTRDVHMTPHGFAQAARMGTLLKGTKIDVAFSSSLVRTIETLGCILGEIGCYDTPTQRVEALNERDYGDYTGKNKWEMKELVGESVFNDIRRSWDCPVPNGETLKMVSERAIPFYEQAILPPLQEGKTVIVASHGNTLRALIMHLEQIPPEEAPDVEMPFGAILLYTINTEGSVLDKKVLAVESHVNA